MVKVEDGGGGGGVGGGDGGGDEGNDYNRGGYTWLIKHPGILSHSGRHNTNNKYHNNNNNNNNKILS